MNLKRFEEERRDDWEALERLALVSDPRRLGPAGVRRRAQLYRSASADLAYARNHFPHDVVVDELERLVSLARTAVYGTAVTRRATVVRYLATGYWQDLWERRRIVSVTAALFVAAIGFGVYLAQTNPEGATVLVPEDFLWITEADTTDQDLATLDLAGFSLFILTNNIRVTVFAFVLGVSFGVLTAALLAYNGVVFGAIGTLAVASGNAEVAVEAVVGHGVLELSCIVVGSAAGLSLGWSMLNRGERRLGEAMRMEGRTAFQLALGTAPWLVVAGILEGFLSRTGTDWLPATAVGLGTGAVYWGLFLWRGRIPAVSEVNDPGQVARPVKVEPTTSP